MAAKIERATVRQSLGALAADERDALARRAGEYGVELSPEATVFVTDSAAEAERGAEEARWHARVSRSLRLNAEQVTRGVVEVQPLPEEPGTDLILDEFVIAGTPDRCASQIQRIERGLGADYFNCSVGIGDLPQAAILRSMERFAREVMPQFAHAGHAA